MKTVEERFAELMQDADVKAWYNSRPVIVKNLMKKYPYLRYKVKEGAPYGISAPGSVVELRSYCESGFVGIALLPENFTAEAKQRILALCAVHGKDPDTMLSNGYFIHVDPEWLEPFE